MERPLAKQFICFGDASPNYPENNRIGDRYHQSDSRKSATGSTLGTIRVAGRPASAGQFLKKKMRRLHWIPGTFLEAFWTNI
jgi:hypothetical protein